MTAREHTCRGSFGTRGIIAGGWWNIDSTGAVETRWLFNLNALLPLPKGVQCHRCVEDWMDNSRKLYEFTCTPKSSTTTVQWQRLRIGLLHRSHPGSNQPEENVWTNQPPPSFLFVSCVRCLLMFWFSDVIVKNWDTSTHHQQIYFQRVLCLLPEPEIMMNCFNQFVTICNLCQSYCGSCGPQFIHFMMSKMTLILNKELFSKVCYLML